MNKQSSRRGVLEISLKRFDKLLPLGFTNEFGTRGNEKLICLSLKCKVPIHVVVSLDGVTCKNDH